MGLLSLGSKCERCVWTFIASMKLPMELSAAPLCRFNQGRRLIGIMPVRALTFCGRTSKRECARMACKPDVTVKLFCLQRCANFDDEAEER